jgi:ankyrin repeat protein
LITAGANVDVVDEDSTTALMAASARGNLAAVKELLNAGAKINEQNNDGHTALMFAYNGKSQVETLWERYTQYIKEATADGTTSEADLDDKVTGPIIRDAFDNHIALVDLLLKSGADPSLKDKEGHTAKDFDYNPDLDPDVLGTEAEAEKIRDKSKYEL